MFVCHGDGWWEFYTGRDDWYQRLRNGWPGGRERSLAEAGLPP